jgi:hypothetical protein
MESIQLNDLLIGVTEISIWKPNWEAGFYTEKKDKLCSTLTSKLEIDEVCLLLRVVTNSSGNLRTMPKYIFELTKEVESVNLGYLGHGFIRWLRPETDIDYKLVYPSDFLKWLKSLDLSDPDKWGEIARNREQQQYEKERKNTLTRIPDILKDKNGEIHKDYLRPESFQDYDLLLKEFASEKEMLLNFIGLFVSESEKTSWKIVSSLQRLIIKILLSVEIRKIDALINEDLDTLQKEGIAKFLTSLEFQKNRKDDLVEIKDDNKHLIMTFLQRQGVGPKIRAFRKKVMN